MQTLPAPPFKGMGKLIHIAAWAILFGLPFFFTGRESQTVTVLSYIRSMIVPLSFVLVFYANYFVLIDHSVLEASLEILAMQCRTDRRCNGSRPSDVRTAPAPRMGTSETGKGMAGDSRLFYGERHAVYAGGRAKRRHQDDRKLVSDGIVAPGVGEKRAEAELQNLKSQLNPHFLFNTLNNIYSLIAFSPERAQEAVHDLSRLLRYVLYDSSQPMVPLEKELDFIRNYVELMRIRLPEHVKLTTDISAATPETLVAPLLFISLIENAFKHGVSHNKPSFIDLKIHQEGTRIALLHPQQPLSER